jgi:hypothetical protein
MGIRSWKLAIGALTLTVAQALAQGTNATPVRPMAADAHPSFAVATIKPHDPNSPCRGCQGLAPKGIACRSATKVSAT